MEKKCISLFDWILAKKKGGYVGEDDRDDAGFFDW